MKRERKNNDPQKGRISKKGHEKQSETTELRTVFDDVERECKWTDSGLKLRYAPETCQSTTRSPSFPVGWISLSTVPVISLLLQ